MPPEWSLSVLVDILGDFVRKREQIEQFQPERGRVPR